MGAFNQRIDAHPYRGKNFRVEAAVKVKAIDSAVEAGCGADRQGK
jgi:hypothetical protein